MNFKNDLRNRLIDRLERFLNNLESDFNSDRHDCISVIRARADAAGVISE